MEVDAVTVGDAAGGGGRDRWDRIRAWLVAHRDLFTAALLR
ncbi:hypothetical protein ACWGKQ_26495 [Streptomyces sp. NPDC054770]